jgi:hypothetical protein
MSINTSAQRTPVFQPAMRIIAAITNANPALVTTTFAHNYKTAMIVRLYIPHGFGMTEANELYSDITVISPTAFTINIDTTFFSVFVVASIGNSSANVVPIGELTNTLAAATVNVLPTHIF